MEKNVGGRDRQARLLIGTILILLGVRGFIGVNSIQFGLTPNTIEGPIKAVILAGVFLITGTLLLLTAAAKKCPINRLFNRNTCKNN